MPIQRIPISNSPVFPGIFRKIAIVGKNEDYLNKSVTLICQLEHYDEQDVRLNATAALEGNSFLLVADNTSKVVAASGALIVLAEGEVYPEDAVGQYDWLKGAVENGANPFDIATAAVLEADAYRRFT